MDVTNLLTDNPLEGSLQANEYFQEKDCNKSISTCNIHKLIEHVLKMNTFHFNGRY